MEIILGIIAVIIIFALYEKLSEKINFINWSKFFIWFIFGSIILAIIFSFTREGVFVVIGAYAILLIVSLFRGLFSK